MPAAMQVLVFEPSYARIRQALHASVPQLQALRMQEDGRLLLDGGVVAPQDAAPQAAWVSSDLYSSPRLRDYMRACLESPALRFLQSSAAGFDNPVFAKLVDRGVVLANSGAAAVGIAEFVLAAVLDLYQPQAQRRDAQRAAQWDRLPFREIAGSCWLIIGVGHIGSEIAKRAQAFDAQVIGVRRSPTGNEPVHRMVAPADLFEVLPLADVVVLAAPANRDSLKLVDAAFLARVKRGAVLVNIARGALVDEAALLAGLDDDRPGAAVLDVFETEPLPAESPLWAHPKLRVSGHVAAFGSGFVARNDTLFLTNIARLAKGQTPINLVDPQVVRQSVPGQARG